MNVNANSTEDPNLGIVLYSRITVSNIVFYGTLFMAIPGVFFNIMNMIIYRRGAFTPSMKFFYTFQSIFDLSSMFLWLIIFFPLRFGVDVNLYSEFGCGLSWYLRRVCGQMSSWAQVLISIDRIFSILFSVRYKAIVGRLYFWTASLGILVVICAACFGNWYYGIVQINAVSNGQVAVQLGCFAKMYGMLISVQSIVFRTVIPFPVMFGSNLILIYSVYSKKAKIKKLSKKELNFAFTIIAMNYAFLLMNTPVAVNQVLEYIPNSAADHLARLNIYRNVSILIIYAYQAYTFLFYLKFNRIFRNEVLKLFFKKFTAQTTTMVSSAT
jgi:hypothetical protein